MPANSERVQSVFLAAVEVADAAARADVLNRACGADVELRRRVEALLRAHHEPGSLLDKPAAGPGIIDEPPPLSVLVTVTSFCGVSVSVSVALLLLGLVSLAALTVTVLDKAPVAEGLTAAVTV